MSWKENSTNKINLLKKPCKLGYWILTEGVPVIISEY